MLFSERGGGGGARLTRLARFSVLFQNLFGHAIQLFGLTSCGVCYSRLRCAASNSDLLCSVLQARDSGVTPVVNLSE